MSKWPRLLVVGHPVTQEQADEILVRTNDWAVPIQSPELRAEVCEIVGIELTQSTNHTYPYDFESVRRFQSEVNALELLHLNNSRVASLWVGGPHGWCDWDGTIGTANYNVGKWPTPNEITRDLMVIGETFSYLNMTLQLVGQEGSDVKHVSQWKLVNGEVTEIILNKPLPLICEIDNKWITEPINSARYDAPGVSLERLRHAVNNVRDMFSHK